MQQYLETSPECCNLKGAREKGLLFYQTNRIIVLYDTRPLVELFLALKSKSHLFNKINRIQTRKFFVTNQAV